MPPIGTSTANSSQSFSQGKAEVQWTNSPILTRIELIKLRWIQSSRFVFIPTAAFNSQIYMTPQQITPAIHDERATHPSCPPPPTGFVINPASQRWGPAEASGKWSHQLRLLSVTHTDPSHLENHSCSQLSISQTLKIQPIVRPHTWPKWDSK